jgi:amino acid adenylation domain-containing protein
MTPHPVAPAQANVTPTGFLPVSERFAEVVRKHGDRPAIADPPSGRMVTYAELDACANRVAAALLDRGGDRTQVVGILMKNGAEGLGTALGVMRAGRYFVGLSAADQAPRIADLVRAVKAELLITHAPCADLAAHVIDPSRLLHLRDLPAPPPGALPAVGPSPADPCFVVLTSGSTGAPKAVVHAHRNQNCDIEFNRSMFNLGPDDRLTLFGSLAGGASLGMALAALCSGSCLYPFDLKVHHAEELATWLQRERITMLQTTPNAFRLFAQHLPPGMRFPDLRVLRVGGDQLRGADIALYQALFEAHTTFFNTFGITEVGTICYQRVGHEDTVPDWIPAGQPCPGRRLVVEDEEGRRLSPGERGYLVIEGPYISSGYLHQPGLTREKFALDPEQPERNRYFTGDLAHLDEDGCCTLWGRNDAQAKINGETVRPGEIERALLSTPGIRDTAITIQNDLDGAPRVVAYVVRANDAPLDPDAVLTHIAGHLTPSMMPAAFVTLPELPRTTAGKIDRLALPTADFSAWAHRPDRQPTTKVQLALAEVWKKVLRIRQVALDDRFIVLGGQSIVAAELVARLSTHLGVNLPLTMLYDAPSLEAQAAYLQGRYDHAVRHWLGEDACALAPPTETPISPLLAPLREGGARTPFFCVAGAGSDPTALAELATCMARQQPFYSFHPDWVNGQLATPQSLEEMASHYVAALRTRQQHGPYLLGGSSFGGLVAWEMARQLEAAGERVALVALLDTRPIGYPPRRPLVTWRRIRWRIARWMLPIGEDRVINRHTLRAGLMQRGWRLRARLTLTFGVSPERLNPLLRYAQLIESHFRAGARYQLKPARFPVVLGRCTVQPPDEFYVNSPTMGWEVYAKGAFAVIPLAGRHGQHIRFPQAEETGRLLQAALDQAIL